MLLPAVSRAGRIVSRLRRRPMRIVRNAATGGMRDRLAQQLFDSAELQMVFRSHETRCSPECLHTTGATDIRHIDSPRGDVRGYEHAERAAPEPFKRSASLRQTTVSM